MNDIVARTGGDEFAILLTDTTFEGAAIKAERFRRMIEAGDFSKAFKVTPRVTVSIVIGEYPSICHDADELFQSADEALLQVRQKTNKVCMAKPPGNFTPDFAVLIKPELI